MSGEKPSLQSPCSGEAPGFCAVLSGELPITVGQVSSAGSWFGGTKTEQSSPLPRGLLGAPSSLLGLLCALSPLLTTFLDRSPHPGSPPRAVPQVNTREYEFHSVTTRRATGGKQINLGPLFHVPLCARRAGNLSKHVFTTKRWP